jgi:hemerythrin-like domain-containing protein
MALSHNSFIRGFNSIYQQAPRIQAIDRKDFIGYCMAWVDCVDQHHHYEETEFFPALDKAAGKVGLMDGAVEQHGPFPFNSWGI